MLNALQLWMRCLIYRMCIQSHSSYIWCFVKSKYLMWPNANKLVMVIQLLWASVKRQSTWMCVRIQLLFFSWSVFTVFQAICCYFLHEQITLYKHLQCEFCVLLISSFTIHTFTLFVTQYRANVNKYDFEKWIQGNFGFCCFFSPILYVDLLLQICIDFRINTMECMSNSMAPLARWYRLLFLGPLMRSFSFVLYSLHLEHINFYSNRIYSDKGHDGVPIEDGGVEKQSLFLLSVYFERAIGDVRLLIFSTVLFFFHCRWFGWEFEAIKLFFFVQFHEIDKL